MTDQPMRDALLNCPFCGSDQVSRSVGQTGDGKPWHYIECEKCAANAEPDAWNRRAYQAGAASRDAARAGQQGQVVAKPSGFLCLWDDGTTTLRKFEPYKIKRLRSATPLYATPPPAGAPPDAAGGARAGWRTIESAPRDGTDFLAMSAGGSHIVARWLHADHPDAEEGECFASAWSNEYIDDPDYWMPLPPLPAAPAQGRKP